MESKTLVYTGLGFFVLLIGLVVLFIVLRKRGGSGSCKSDCENKQCGSDSCGGTCGNCAVGVKCENNGMCRGSGHCKLDCENKQCGSDGCGGTCGSCESGSCTNGKCTKHQRKPNTVDCGDGIACNVKSGAYCCYNSKCEQAGAGCTGTPLSCGKERDVCGMACADGTCKDESKTCNVDGNCVNCLPVYAKGTQPPAADDPKFIDWVSKNINTVPAGIRWDPAKGLSVDAGKTYNKGVCPYGMELTSSGGEYDCRDSMPTGCTKDTCIRGQKIVKAPGVVTPTKAPNIYLTWFGFSAAAKINQKAAKQNCQLTLAFVKSTRTLAKTKNYPGNGIAGLSYPLGLPDKNNYTWMFGSAKGQAYDSASLQQLGISTAVGYDTSKELANNYYKMVADWTVTNFVIPALNDGTRPGFLLNPNFHYATSFVLFPQGGANVGWDNNQTASYLPGCVGWASSMTGPLPKATVGLAKWIAVNKKIGKPGAGPAAAGIKDPTNKVTCIGWSAWMEWFRIYILSHPQLIKKKVNGESIWFHWDKEWCGCGDPGQYIYLIRSAKMWRKTIISLPSGETMPGIPPLTPRSKDVYKNACGQPSTTTSDCYRSAIGSPELYWGVGIQYPCVGGPGQYDYLPATCTSWSTKRALQDQPKAYYDLIMGPSDTEGVGSDACPGWGGHGAFKLTGKQASATAANWPSNTSLLDKATYGDNIWPSFSIENLSMCDRNKPTCTSLAREVHTGGEYKFTEYSTGCMSTFIKGDLEKMDPLPHKECGTFDGFSYWSWQGMNNWLNYYSNQFGVQNMIIYEASFIPYSWFKEVIFADDESSSDARAILNNAKLASLLMPEVVPSRCNNGSCPSGLSCTNGFCLQDPACGACGAPECIVNKSQDKYGRQCDCGDATALAITKCRDKVVAECKKPKGSISIKNLLTEIQSDPRATKILGESKCAWKPNDKGYTCKNNNGFLSLHPVT